MTNSADMQEKGTLAEDLIGQNESGTNAEQQGNNSGEGLPDSQIHRSEPIRAEIDPRQLEEFAVQLATYTHDSWYGQWDDGALMLRLKSNTRSHKHISNEIASQMGLNQILPDDLGSRYVLDVALAEGQQIQSVVWHLGLVVLGDNFKTTLDGSRIRIIVDAIGLESLQFSVKNAGRIVLSNGGKYGILQSKFDDNFEQLKVLVVQSGLELLGVMCGSNHLEIYHRILVKLPFKWSDGVMLDGDVMLDESAEKILLELQSHNRDISSILGA